MKLYSDEALAKILDKEMFHLIGDVADEMGVECYVVGGFVRDIFLERPSNDIDVVVVGSGIEVAKALKNRLGKKAHLSVFKNFGTAQVKYKPLTSHPSPLTSEIEIEFVGARKESYSHDSRKPIVEDGTLEDDQNRRDFTINAMAICLNKKRFGELVDPFNGIADLEDGIIATPLDPEVTFSDDPLRMMRCIRFATQLNFEIEDETFDALSRMADRIRIVSGWTSWRSATAGRIRTISTTRWRCWKTWYPPPTPPNGRGMDYGCVGQPCCTTSARRVRSGGSQVSAGRSITIIL